MSVSTNQRLVAKCNELADFLVEKNDKYGNSYSAGVAVFSDLSPQERIRSRIDEKLNRIRAGSTDEDTVWDLAGLLVHLLIQRDIAEGK